MIHVRRLPAVMLIIVGLALACGFAWAAPAATGDAAQQAEKASYEMIVMALTVVVIFFGGAFITRALLRLGVIRSYVWVLPVLGALSGAAWAGVLNSSLGEVEKLTQLLRFLCLMAVFLCVLYLVARAAMPSQIRRTRAAVPPFIRTLVILICAVIGFFILLTSSFPTLSLTPVFVTSGALSIVIGLAVQDLLSNVLAGVVLSAEQPFKAGDWVQIGDLEGAVAEISWRATKIITRRNDCVEVPNSMIVRERVMNFDRPTSLHLRRVHVGVTYETPPALAINALMEAASRVINVLDKPAPHVHFHEFADSSLVYELRVYIDNYASAPAIDSELRKEIWYSFKRHGITIPFPQRDVNFRQIAESDTQARARLVAAAGLPRGFFVELGETDFTIGRAPENVLCLTDQHVSGHHAVIERKDGAFELRDLGSHRGTKVNGTPVQSATLWAGDVIEIGPVVLVFETNQMQAGDRVYHWMTRGGPNMPGQPPSETTGAPPVPSRDDRTK